MSMILSMRINPFRQNAEVWFVIGDFNIFLLYIGLFCTTVPLTLVLLRVTINYIHQHHSKENCLQIPMLERAYIIPDTHSGRQ